MTHYEQFINMLVSSNTAYKIEHNTHKTVWTVTVIKGNGIVRFHFDNKTLSLQSVIIRDAHHEK
jgi:hypothetical protein